MTSAAASDRIGPAKAPAKSLRTFVTLWAGQFVSLTGSALTSFALGVHAYRLTGSVTTLGLIYVLAFLPYFVASPFTGSLVDRWGPRRAMMTSCVAAAAVLLVLALLLATRVFVAWHLFVVVSALAVFGSLQTPAFEAAIPAMVPSAQLGRANGMRILAVAASQVFAPIAAGFLLLAINIAGILVLDCVSFGFALISLLLVRIPIVSGTPARQMTPIGLLADFVAAWHFVARRPALVALLAFTASVNFFGGFIQILITPLVLSFAPTNALGTVLSTGGAGLVVAGATMSTWGGPRNRMAGVLGFSMVMGAACVLGALRPNVVLLAVAAFLVLGSSGIVIGCNQVLWQTKVDPALLGRVMAILGMLFSLPQLFSYGLAGLTADLVFAPLTGDGGAAAPLVAVLVGTGPGRGYALLIMTCGVLILVCAVAGSLYPRLRRLDLELPDLTRPEQPEPTAMPAARRGGE